jgi:hypothetical protein
MSGDNWTPQNGEDYYGEDSFKENNYYNLFKNIQDETNFIKTKKKKKNSVKNERHNPSRRKRH